MAGLIFWEQQLRVAGPGTMADAVVRLRSQLSAGRFSMQERLAGSLGESRIRVWKASPIAQAGDVVEFEGSLKAIGEETVIEGTLRYKIATKVQFIGLLAIGLVLAAAGTLRELGGITPGGELLGIGAFVFVAALLWVYSSGRMKHEQIRFIEARLAEVVAK